MRYDKEIYERIESYLNGDLTPEENLAFGQQIAADETLAAEVQAWVLANQAIEASAYNELRQEIREGIRQYDRQTSSRWKLGAAILLGGIVLSGLLIVLQPDQESPETVSPVQDTIEKKEVEISVSPDTMQPSPDKRSVPPVSQRDKPVQNLNRSLAETDSLPIVLVESDSAVSKLNSFEKVPDSLTDKKEESLTEVQSEHRPAEHTPDCSGFRAEVQPDLRPACEGQADGAITFDQITAGGQTFYTILRPGAKRSSDSYSGLYSGSYTFIVTNQDGCSDTVRVYLPGKSCRKRDFVLNPEAGETWEIPVSEGDVFDIQIMDMSGQVVFNRIRERKFAWNGGSNRGEVLPSGLYIYMITLEDKTQLNGQITIIR